MPSPMAHWIWVSKGCVCSFWGTDGNCFFLGLGCVGGHGFKPANIHAGGLRYHGAGVIMSQLMKDGFMEAVDIQQNESFKAGILFAQTEGIIPAPESCHAIAATVREALKCKETGEAKTILFNLSGHGFVDMSAYDQYLEGNLQDYTVSDADIARFIKDADELNA